MQLDPTLANKSNNETATITESKIIAQYQAVSSSNAMLNVDPPFFVSIQSQQNMSILHSFDGGANSDITLFAGVNKTLPAFVESGNILFPNSLGVTTLINGVSPGLIEDQTHPVRIEINSTPPSVKITHYAPSFN